MSSPHQASQSPGVTAHRACRRPRRRRLGNLALLALGPILLGACITESAPSGLPEIFDFSPSLSGELFPSGTYHNTALIIELEESELPRAEGGRPTPTLSVVLPAVQDDGSELYVLPGDRELRYANERWSVGFFSYTQRRGAGGRLYVFRTHRDDFEFRLHGQRIVVAASGSWVPSVFYSAETDASETQERASRLPGVRRAIYRGEAYVDEWIRIGRAEIRTDGRTGLWNVNGQSFRPQADGAPLILEDVVPVVAP